MAQLLGPAHLSTGLPTRARHRHPVWTWDFIFDRTDKGGTLKMMTLLDEYTRQSLAIQVERQLTASEVLAVLCWKGQWPAMGYRVIFAVTMVLSLSLLKFNNG